MTTTTEVIGRYEVLAEIGRSDLGVVYQGHDSEVDRVVAIKAVPLSEFPESNPLQFFLDARAAKRLSHPGIVELYDVGISNEKEMLYLVREYVAGVTLETILQSGSMPPEAALRAAKELADALDHAHREGFVHGNVQPYNILITEEGHAKLAEFSGCKLSRTVHGDNVFAAPEEIATGAVDVRSDVFSLGAVLYTMLTGHVPFHGRNASPVDWSAHRRALSIANNGPLSISPDVDQLLAKALAKGPADRFPVARQMAYALQKVLEPVRVETELEEIVPESLAPTDVKTVVAAPAITASASDDIEIVLSMDSFMAFVRAHRLWVIPSAAAIVICAFMLIVGSLRTDPTPQGKSTQSQSVRRGKGTKPAAGLPRASRSRNNSSDKRDNDKPEQPSAAGPQQ